MFLEKIRHDTGLLLLESLENKEFGWELVEAIAQANCHPPALVKLSFSNDLSNVLKALYSYLIKQVIHQIEHQDLSALRIPEKIRKILEISFLTLDAYKPKLQHLFKPAIMLKFNITYYQLLYEIVNRVWYRIEDQSTDYNFYTKRLLLSFVYVPTFLFWLKESNSIEQTIKELDRRLNQVGKLSTLKKKIFR